MSTGLRSFLLERLEVGIGNDLVHHLGVDLHCVVTFHHVLRRFAGAEAGDLGLLCHIGNGLLPLDGDRVRQYWICSFFFTVLTSSTVTFMLFTPVRN